CRIHAFPNGKEAKFLVRHGEACKREPAIKDGESTAVFFRPEKYGVVSYNAEQGELRIHCSSGTELQELRRAFGAHLFANEEFFPGATKYTLAPLVTGRECLVCQDIDGIQKVKLTAVEFLEAPRLAYKAKHSAKDIYSVIESGKMKWPADPSQISRATFQVMFSGAKSPRTVRLEMPNKVSYGRDEDSELMENWMQARGFIVGVEDVRPASAKSPMSVQPMFDL
ncbi:MAG: hypothetical protein ACK4UN_13905, partial [Limisphaerales bacterium]